MYLHDNFAHLFKLVLFPQIFSGPAKNTIVLGPYIPLFRPANKVNLVHFKLHIKFRLTMRGVNNSLFSLVRLSNLKPHTFALKIVTFNPN